MEYQKMAREKSQRLTVKSIMGDISMNELIKTYLVPAGPLVPVSIFRIAGKVDSIKTSQFAETVEFRGVFHVINLISGKMHDGTSVIFPRAIQESLMTVIAKFDKKKPVEFGYEITATLAYKTVVGTTFGIDMGAIGLADPRSSEELAGLLADIPNFHKLPDKPKKNVKSHAQQERENREEAAVLSAGGSFAQDQARQWQEEQAAGAPAGPLPPLADTAAAPGDDPDMDEALREGFAQEERQNREAALLSADAAVMAAADRDITVKNQKRRRVATGGGR
jgi:hypothetical protein